MDVLIFRPKNNYGPSAPVVVHPGANYYTTPPEIDDINPGEFSLDFLIKSGRTLVWPAWKGSLNRMPKARTASNDELMRYFRNLYIAWVNDTDKVLDYLETRDEIDSNNVTITGISYGGSLLLNSSLDKRMNSPKPKSLLIYGAAYEIDTGLDFLLSGKLTHNNNTIHITPNEWGITVILHNYLKNIDVGFDTKAIREILAYRIADDMNTVDRLKEKLNSHDKEFVNNVLNATYNEISLLLKNEILPMDIFKVDDWTHCVEKKTNLFFVTYRRKTKHCVTTL